MFEETLVFGEPPLKDESIESMLLSGEKEYGESGGYEEKRTGKWKIIAAVFLGVFAASGVYFSGVLDLLRGGLEKAPQETVSRSSIEIELLKGFFVENKTAGRLFTIEGKIRNASMEPQQIKAVKGIIYNGSGKAIADRTVAPGRIVSGEDLKNLSREDLLKHFQDVSGGSIPPKGTIPVMVVFTDIPGGIAEYEIEIIR